MASFPNIRLPRVGVNHNSIYDEDIAKERPQLLMKLKHYEQHGKKKSNAHLPHDNIS